MAEVIDIDDFSEVQVGDIVHRLLAGVVPMDLRVTEIEDGLLRCGGPEGWTFDRKTGIEEDPELGWGVSFGITGSWLVKEYPDTINADMVGPTVEDVSD